MLTLRDLIINWLTLYPGDACSIDLVHNARAGYVQLKGQNQYTEFKEWRSYGKQ